MKKTRKIVSILLCFAMLLTMTNAFVFASEASVETTQNVYVLDEENLTALSSVKTSSVVVTDNGEVREDNSYDKFEYVNVFAPSGLGSSVNMTNNKGTEDTSDDVSYKNQSMYSVFVANANKGVVWNINNPEAANNISVADGTYDVYVKTTALSNSSASKFYLVYDESYIQDWRSLRIFDANNSSHRTDSGYGILGAGDPAVGYNDFVWVAVKDLPVTITNGNAHTIRLLNCEADTAPIYDKIMLVPDGTDISTLDLDTFDNDVVTATLKDESGNPRATIAYDKALAGNDIPTSAVIGTSDINSAVTNETEMPNLAVPAKASYSGEWASALQAESAEYVPEYTEVLLKALLSNLTYTIEGEEEVVVPEFNAIDEGGSYVVELPGYVNGRTVSVTAYRADDARITIEYSDGKNSFVAEEPNETIVIEAKLVGDSITSINRFSIRFDLTAQAMLRAYASGGYIEDENGNTVATDKAYDINTKITLVAVAEEGYTFAYWIDNNSGRIVSEEEIYEFTLVSDKNVSVVFTSDTNKTVVFKNQNGQIVARTEIGEGENITVPANPYYMGYVFAGWKLGGVLTELEANVQIGYDELESGETVYNAYFEKSQTEYSLLLTDATALPEKDAYNYDDKIKVTANDAGEGMVFSHWLKDGETVSYDAEYTFYMGASDTTLVAKYDTVAPEKAPVIIMTNPVPLAGEGKIAFFAERNLYADEENGRVLIETGILVNTNESVSDFGFDDGILKATSTSKNGKGQFTVRKAGLEDGDVVRARAYMIYSDASGIHTVFSNIVEGTY